uniref:TNF family profile domain-containing protein n=1 Tax=Knipowitschia caucasica TaxID=637954 RepID=A0AAV2KEZ0_KNICA
MSKSNHKTLLRVLLWWATFLSLCQAALLLLFFTMGGYRQPSSELGIPHVRTKMFNYKASAAVYPNRTLTWYAVYSKDLPMDEGHLGDLSIKEDGYFFVCLRITLISSSSDVDEVSLKEVKDTGAETLLTGWIDNQTLSTGLLCKTERLSIGSALRVQIKTKHPENVRINDSQSLSSLDLIYIPY